MKTAIFISFFLIFSSFSFLSDAFTSLNSSSLNGIEAIQNNPAGLANHPQTAVGIFYENSFLIPGLNTKGLAGVFAFRQNVFGLCYSSYGFKLYSEKKINLVYAKAFGKKFFAGVSLDYLKTTIGENYGSKNALIAEVGIQAVLSSKLLLGTHIYNPTRASLAQYNDEHVPTIFKLGLTYTLSSKICISVEAEKDIDFRAIYKTVIEYQPVKGFFLKTGMSSNPSLAYFGLSLEHSKLRFDISANYHLVLGVSSLATLSYYFK